MNVHVEGCWNGTNGGDNGGLSFRLSIPKGRGRNVGGYWRESVGGMRWNRRVAAQALDILESLYGVDRRTVRFIHK